MLYYFMLVFWSKIVNLNLGLMKEIRGGDEMMLSRKSVHTIHSQVCTPLKIWLQNVYSSKPVLITIVLKDMRFLLKASYMLKYFIWSIKYKKTSSQLSQHLDSKILMYPFQLWVFCGSKATKTTVHSFLHPIGEANPGLTDNSAQFWHKRARTMVRP